MGRMVGRRRRVIMWTFCYCLYWTVLVCNVCCNIYMIFCYAAIIKIWVSCIFVFVGLTNDCEIWKRSPMVILKFVLLWIFKVFKSKSLPSIQYTLIFCLYKTSPPYWLYVLMQTTHWFVTFRRKVNNTTIIVTS